MIQMFNSQKTTVIIGFDWEISTYFPCYNGTVAGQGLIQ